jgi:hypothetical protein
MPHLRLLTALLLAVSAGLTGCSNSDDDKDAPEKNQDSDFIQFSEDLNPHKQTRLYVKEHWKKIQGTQVTWSGSVWDVRESRGMAEVFLAKPEGHTYRGYNVVARVPDLQAAGNLKKGDHVTVRGVIYRFQDARNGTMIFHLESATLLSDDKQ